MVYVLKMNSHCLQFVCHSYKNDLIHSGNKSLKNCKPFCNRVLEGISYAKNLNDPAHYTNVIFRQKFAVEPHLRMMKELLPHPQVVEYP